MCCIVCEKISKYPVYSTQRESHAPQIIQPQVIRKQKLLFVIRVLSSLNQLSTDKVLSEYRDVVTVVEGAGFNG